MNILDANEPTQISKMGVSKPLVFSFLVGPVHAEPDWHLLFSLQGVAELEKVCIAGNEFSSLGRKIYVDTDGRDSNVRQGGNHFTKCASRSHQVGLPVALHALLHHLGNIEDCDRAVRDLVGPFEPPLQEAVNDPLQFDANLHVLDPDFASYEEGD